MACRTLLLVESRLSEQAKVSSCCYASAGLPRTKYAGLRAGQLVLYDQGASLSHAAYPTLRKDKKRKRSL